MKGDEMTNYEYSNLRNNLKWIDKNHENVCEGNLKFCDEQF